MTEVWAPIEGHCGYEISNKGRVRRVDDTGVKYLRGHKQSGYPFVTLYPGKRKVPIHALVATAFHGPRPDGMQCAHLNGNKLDNRAENLAWVTCTENNRHKAIHGTMPEGERHGQAVLNADEVAAIRSAYAHGETGKSLADRYGVASSTVSAIVRGKTWRCLHVSDGTPEAEVMQSGRRHADERSKRVKLTAELVREARRMRSEGQSLRSIGEAFGVSAATIRDAVTGATWRHV